MKLAQLAGAALLLVPTLAGAEAKPIYPSGSAQFGDIVGTKPNQDDLVFGRQVLPPQGPQHAVAQSRVIYLNKNGVTLLPGNNDSRTNRSTIASQQTQIPAWNVSATTWNATVACVREIFAPFDVQVVETDPGNVPHIEAVFGGSPTQLGMPNNVAGVSPFTTDCSIIENSIVFTFTNVIPADARLACEIQAQEIAHSFGLDHELLASDPMTYLDYNGNRSFKNQAASCGEDVQRPCGINGSVCRNNQNSVTLLNERLGINTGGGGTGNDPTLGTPILEQLKAKAREAKACGTCSCRSSEHGAGLTNLEYAPLCEVMGRLAPRAGGVQLLRARHRQHGGARALRHRPSRRRTWLEPLLAGEIRSASR
jgi:hypothetical protein